MGLEKEGQTTIDERQRGARIRLIVNAFETQIASFYVAEIEPHVELLGECDDNVSRNLDGELGHLRDLCNQFIRAREVMKEGDENMSDVMKERRALVKEKLLDMKKSIWESMSELPAVKRTDIKPKVDKLVSMIDSMVAVTTIGTKDCTKLTDIDAVEQGGFNDFAQDFAASRMHKEMRAAGC